MRTKRFVTTLLLVSAVIAPAALVTGRAMADDDDDAPSDEPASKGQAPRKSGTPARSPAEIAQRRQAALAAMATDDTALINVTRAEMPASPDVWNLGRRGARALARCVSDNVDDVLRATCAHQLGRMGDKAGLTSLQGALEAWDPSVRGAAIGALARMPDRSSTGPLIKVLEREDEAVHNRAAALEALGLMANEAALSVLTRSLHGTPELRLAAFHGLWRTRHLLARPALVGHVTFALESGEPELVLAATFAASEMKAPELVGPLSRLMQVQDARVRNRAVYALGKIGSPAATKALLGQLPKVRESRMLNNIAFALERLDPKAFFVTAENMMGHKQAQIRMNAAYVVGDVRRPEGMKLLTSALGDQNHTVKLSAVTALGKLDAPEVSKVLEAYVDDPDPSLSRAAIYGIYAASGWKRTDLVHDKLFANPARPGERLEAAIALGRAKDPRAVPELLGCLERRGCRLDDVAGPLLASKSPDVPGRTLLAWVRGRTDLTDLVAALAPAGATGLAISDVQAGLATGTSTNTMHAIDLAGDLGKADALAGLTPLLAHPDRRLRLHAAVALSRAGVVAADKVLFDVVDEIPHDGLPRLARLLARVSEPEARTRLLPEMSARIGKPDVDIALALAAAHFAWDPERGIFRMLAALRSSSRHERDLAVRYLLDEPSPRATELLRRALAREGSDVTAGELRRILDLRQARPEAWTLASK